MRTCQPTHWLHIFLIAGCCLGAAQVPAQALADDLCNFNVEGLSLDSSKTELDARLQALGWQAHSVSAINIRTRKEETIYTYTRLPPEVPAADGYRPGEKQPRYDSSFTLRIIDGLPSHLSYSHHFASEQDFASNGIASPLQQAQAFCAQTDARFALSGCNRVYSGANVMALSLVPVDKTSAYCRVNLSAREGSSVTFTVDRISDQQAGALQEKAERRSR